MSDKGVILDANVTGRFASGLDELPAVPVNDSPIDKKKAVTDEPEIFTQSLYYDPGDITEDSITQGLDSQEWQLGGLRGYCRRFAVSKEAKFRRLNYSVEPVVIVLD